MPPTIANPAPIRTCSFAFRFAFLSTSFVLSFGLSLRLALSFALAFRLSTTFPTRRKPLIEPATFLLSFLLSFPFLITFALCELGTIFAFLSHNCINFHRNRTSISFRRTWHLLANRLEDIIHIPHSTASRVGKNSLFHLLV